MTNFETNNQEIKPTEISSENILENNFVNRLKNGLAYREKVKSEIDSQDIGLLIENIRTDNAMQEMCIDRCNAYLV